VRVKRPAELSPLAPLEEALAASVSSISNRSIGPPSEADLLGRLIRDNLTYLIGHYIIPEELTGVYMAGESKLVQVRVADHITKAYDRSVV
jgi:hypothetical protein